MAGDGRLQQLEGLDRTAAESRIAAIQVRRAGVDRRGAARQLGSNGRQRPRPAGRSSGKRPHEAVEADIQPSPVRSIITCPGKGLVQLLLLLCRKLLRSEVEGELVDRAGELERRIVAILHQREAGAGVTADVEGLVLGERDRGAVPWNFGPLPCRPPRARLSRPCRGQVQRACSRRR